MEAFAFIDVISAWLDGGWKAVQEAEGLPRVVIAVMLFFLTSFFLLVFGGQWRDTPIGRWFHLAPRQERRASWAERAHERVRNA